MKAAVIGGGLAGITTALRLADAGASVALYEAKPKLGGLTHSFRRELGDGSISVDNGQHVFLRCCTAYRALLDRLGVTGLTHLQPRLEVIVRSEASGRVGRLRRAALPAPLHLGPALATYPWLGAAAKARAVSTALALSRVDRNDPATDQTSFGAWLRAHGQGARAMEALWELIGVATLNAAADRASLAMAATIFQVGLLDRADAADIGWPTVPLQELHGDAALRALGQAGVQVRTSSKITDLDALDAEAVVVAVPPTEAARLLPADALDLPTGWAQSLGSSPIVNLNLVYDRPILDEAFVATVDSPLQWIFDKTSHAGLTQGQYVAVSLSAADDLIDLPVARLRELFLPHLEALLPRARGAELRDFFVTRERHATFLAAPGTGRLRPGARTARRGLYVAGAWTATGWPATMEGAVRSGDAAAAAVLEDRTSLMEVA